MAEIIIPTKETAARRRFLAWLGGVIVLPAAPAWAKLLGTIKLNPGKDFFCDSVSDGSNLGEIYTFAADKDAEKAVEDICRAAGVAQKFEVQAYSQNNAAALVRGGRRFVLYGGNFMRDAEQKTGTKWGPVSIMAHEIGHHINAHTFSEQGDRRELELEADIFSGGVLQKLGATLEESQAAMRFYTPEKGTDTHPGKTARLQAIYSGWRDSCDLSKCDKTEPSAETKRPPQNADNLNALCNGDKTCVIEW
ncbi:MAG: hypothetical protein HAW59_03180 [Betaproteobacteria bacterium]|nr:hypothetical protein [Betaproteobacteria bacterium]